jgi:hypothetical protein
MNGLRKCGVYIQWNFIQPQRRMKFCRLQVNANGNANGKHHLKQSQPGSESQKSRFLSYVEYRLNTNTAIL